MLTQGVPRLVTVSSDSVAEDDTVGELPTGVQARVLLNEDPALLPDLAQIEGLIGEALRAAA